jgi:hypothetical protein
MAASLSIIAAKDGAAATIVGGILAMDKSGAGTGPFYQAQTLVDTQGVNTLTIKAASTAPVATDTGVVVSIHPLSVNANVTNAGDAVASSATAGAPVVNYGYGYNGATWDRLQVDGSKNLKVALTSTTITGNVAVTIATAPALVASTASIGTVQTGVTATANGATASRINAAATTNATNLKASAGQLYTIDVFNAAAYNVFLKLYNKASAPTVGTDTPIATYPIQAGGGFSKTWPMGLSFATGISYAITKLQADSDTTVVVAGDLTGNTTWI